jgi:hypothetical protein
MVFGFSQGRMRIFLLEPFVIRTERKAFRQSLKVIHNKSSCLSAFVAINNERLLVPKIGKRNKRKQKSSELSSRLRVFA